MRILKKTSRKTKSWLRRIRTNLTRSVPDLEYREREHGMAVHNPRTGRNVAFLDTTANQIRVFTILEVDKAPDLLEPTSSTGNYEEYYPSFFTMTSIKDLSLTEVLIARAYENDN